LSDHQNQPDWQNEDLESAKILKNTQESISTEIKKRIIGQAAVIDELLITLFSQGHCLIVGVPGLAKTLLISTLSEILNLTFNRIQFTPDLMPSDITGTDILQDDSGTGGRSFRFIQGPIFAYQVTAGGNTYPLKKPFFVLATQNPIEQEGTYPLPEAQLDRFMFNIYIDYPNQADEKQIVMHTTSAYEPTLNSVTDSDEIIRIQQIVRKVPVAESVVDFAVALARLSRPTNPDAPDFIKNWVNWGAGPRASQYMILGAKARAIMHGRYHVTYDDVKSIAKPVLRHRILTNFNAEADEITSLDIIEKLLELNLENH